MTNACTRNAGLDCFEVSRGWGILPQSRSICQAILAVAQIVLIAGFVTAPCPGQTEPVPPDEVPPPEEVEMEAPPEDGPPEDGPPEGAEEEMSPEMIDKLNKMFRAKTPAEFNQGADAVRAAAAAQTPQTAAGQNKVDLGGGLSAFAGEGAVVWIKESDDRMKATAWITPEEHMVVQLKENLAAGRRPTHRFDPRFAQYNWNWNLLGGQHLVEIRTNPSDNSARHEFMIPPEAMKKLQDFTFEQYHRHKLTQPAPNPAPERRPGYEVSGGLVVVPNGDAQTWIVSTATAYDVVGSTWIPESGGGLVIQSNDKKWTHYSDQLSVVAGDGHSLGELNQEALSDIYNITKEGYPAINSKAQQMNVPAGS